MNDRKGSHYFSLLLVATAVVVLIAGVLPGRGQQTSASPSVSTSDKPYLVEWVYKVKWGHSDEFWQIFKKYQISGKRPGTTS